MEGGCKQKRLIGRYTGKEAQVASRGAVLVCSYRFVAVRGAQAKHSFCCRLAGLFAWSAQRHTSTCRSAATTNHNPRNAEVGQGSVVATPHLHRHASSPFLQSFYSPESRRSSLVSGRCLYGLVILGVREHEERERCVATYGPGPLHFLARWRTRTSRRSIYSILVEGCIVMCFHMSRTSFYPASVQSY